MLKSSPTLKSEIFSKPLLWKNTATEIEVKIKTTMEALPVIESCKDNIDGFEVLRGTMDDAFIAITGKEIRE